MPSGGASEQYRVRDLVVDVTGASVSRGGERLVVPPRTFELLVALVRRYPSTVRRHDLLDSVWAGEHVTDQTLSHRVMVLRQALGDHAEQPVYVAGERGFGYRLIAPVERIRPDESLADAGGAAAPRRGRRSVAFVVAATAVLALALAGAWLISRRGVSTAPRGAPTSRAASAPENAAAQAARLDRLCLRGEFFFLSFTEESLRRSAEAWEQALALAPRHPRAHAGQAITVGVRAYLDHVSPGEAEPLARRAQQRALELDPRGPPSRLATSLVRLLFDWDATAAAAAARAAVAADPDDLRGPIVLALALQGQGQLEASERVLDAATLDAPYSAAAAFLEGRSHQMRARWADAVAAYDHALVLEPDLVAARRGTAECLTAGGQADRALAALGVGAAGTEAPNDTLHATWRRLCIGGGTSGETLRACVLAGDVERAQRLLGAAVAARSPFVVLAPHEALLQPLHHGPAWSALVARLRQPLRPKR